MPTAIDVADRFYASWNEEGLGVLADSVDPDIELICDPLHPDESALHGHDGWDRWVARWEETYEAMHIAIDALVDMGAEHVLAFVTITATPRGGQQLTWAAAHLWTVRHGRIARWEPHVDLVAARGTLDDH